MKLAKTQVILGALLNIIFKKSVRDSFSGYFEWMPSILKCITVIFKNSWLSEYLSLHLLIMFVTEMLKNGKDMEEIDA